MICTLKRNAWLTLLVVLIAVLAFAMAEFAPMLMASVDWHDMTSVGWYDMASIGWHGSGTGG